MRLSLFRGFNHGNLSASIVHILNQAVAPIVYLYTTDPYRPSDIGAQLEHTVPKLNFIDVVETPSRLSLNNLNLLNALGNESIYLTSTNHIDIYDNPTWTKGVSPDSTGATDGAVSCAIVINAHDESTVDVFYMYFYA